MSSLTFGSLTSSSKVPEIEFDLAQGSKFSSSGIMTPIRNAFF